MAFLIFPSPYLVREIWGCSNCSTVVTSRLLRSPGSAGEGGFPQGPRQAWAGEAAPPPWEVA